MCEVCTKYYAEWENISGTSLVQYFEQGNFVGERMQYSCGASLAGVRFSSHYPHIAYVCPACGELWGRAILTHQFDYKPYLKDAWRVEVRRCVECGDGQFLPDRTDFDHTSPALLLREVQVLLEGYEL